MTTRSALATTLYALATLALVAAAPACSSAEAPDAEPDATKNAISGGGVTVGETTDFAGAFELPSDTGSTKFNFSVTNIDWTANTARWDSKIIKADGRVDNVDRDKAMTITRARCPNNCFKFTVEADNGFTGNDAFIAVINFEDGTIRTMTYTGYDAKNARLTKGSSCVLTCEGTFVACSEGGTESSCEMSRFAGVDVPRCPSEVTFAETSCPAR